MDDQQKLGQDLGPQPATGLPVPLMPQPVVEPVIPDVKLAEPKAEPVPPEPVEPVPLPKATDIEEVLPPLPPPPVDKPVVEPSKSDQQGVHPLFEKPVTVAPEAKSEQRTANREQRKLPKGMIAGIAALVFLVVGGLVVIPNKIARDPYWGYIGIKAANGCSNGLCPVIGTDGKIQGYIPADQPVKGTYQDVLDARVGVIIGTQPSAPAGTFSPKVDSPEVQKAIQENKVQIEGNGKDAHIVRDPANPATGGVVTTSGNILPTFDKVKNSLASTNSLNTQANVNKIISDIQINAPSTSLPSSTEAPPPDFENYEYITFSCSRCGADRRCQTEIGSNPVFIDGSSPGGCSQVDRRRKGSDDSYDMVSLCSPSCSGGETVQQSAGGGDTGGGNGGNPTVPATVSANCQSLTAQMSDGLDGWVNKTDAEFIAAARPGDKVRFVCTGHKTQGNFTKSAFFINSVLHVDDVVKLNDTQFAVEYTIGAAGALKVESVLLHDSKGWVD